MLDRLRVSHDIEDAATINILPLSGSFDCTTMEVVDGPPVPAGEEVCPQIRTVSPSYARVAGMDVVAGRFLEPTDTADTVPVAVVSASLARALWPDDPSPIGRRLWRGEGRAQIEVVGVAGEVAHLYLQNPPAPTIYVAHAQNLISWHERRATVLVRTSGDPLRVASVARGVARELDPLLPLANLRTMRDVVSASVAPERFRTMLLVAFASSALLLAAIGVYGVIAYAVSRQRHEVAIRVALGAGRQRILRHVLGTGLAPVAVGTVVGLAVTVLGSRLLDGMLYGVARTDPLALASVPVILLAVALVAAWIPARRAGRVHPAEALRAD
jgi:putative ABC transport system permease protein